MKYFKRLGIYKVSNCTYDPLRKVAFSYGWWQFLTQLPDGRLVFNEHPYSVSTSGHQRKVRVMLGRAFWEIALYVDVPEGLQRSDWPELAIAEVDRRIDALKDAMARGRKVKNEERAAEIVRLLAKRHELVGVVRLLKEGSAA